MDDPLSEERIAEARAVFVIFPDDAIKETYRAALALAERVGKAPVYETPHGGKFVFTSDIVPVPSNGEGEGK